MGLLSLTFVVAGWAFILGGLWLGNDLWRFSWYTPFQSNPNWQFCYPLYVRCVNAAIASEPADVSIGLVIVGSLLLSAGTFSLGFYIRSRSWPM